MTDEHAVLTLVIQTGRSAAHRAARAEKTESADG